jgi:hypothetical protein
MASITELTLSGGDRVRIDGDPHEVEAAILAAARGSLMEFAWLTEADSGQAVGVNPERVAMIRATQPGPDR